jgi:pimeloyl-ACP methyl ester carboxylesterase
VVFLPGTNFNAATSVELMAAFVRAGLTVTCADLPGQPGLSAPDRPSAEEPAYAAWIGEVLTHVRRDLPAGGTVTLVGHSRGAAVALTAPVELVDHLVLVSPAGLVDVRPTWQMLRATMPWLVRRNVAGSRRLARLMTGPLGSPSPELVDWLTLVARSSRTTGAPGRCADSALHRWRARSVRVLIGEHDCFFPPGRLRDPVREELGTDLSVVAGAGHLLVDQAPESVVAAVA